jgi:hypothetical protein
MSPWRGLATKSSRTTGMIEFDIDVADYPEEEVQTDKPKGR